MSNSEDLKKMREALSDYYELARKLRDDEIREAGYAEDEHEGMLRAEEAIHLFDAHITALSQQEAEPVAYQCRMRASWNSDQLWTKWEECSKGTFEDYKRAPTNSDWYFESRALYEHPPKPAALPQPEREQFSWEREREQPVASVPQDSEDSFERWVNTHPGYTYRDVWQAGREYQSWLSVASVPQDVETQKATIQMENWRYDSEELEALHMNLDDAGAPRHSEEGEKYSAWGRVCRIPRENKEPQDVEEFIKNSSDKGIWFHDQKVVPVDALRTLMAGKVLVPVEGKIVCDDIPVLAIKNGNIWHTEISSEMVFPPDEAVYLYAANTKAMITASKEGA